MSAFILEGDGENRRGYVYTDSPGVLIVSESQSPQNARIRHSE